MYRKFSVVDRVLMECDAIRHTLWVPVMTATRAYPVAPEDYPAPTLSRSEQRHAAGCMRVNHVGEVCAQALYQGQAITTRSPALRKKLAHAAAEERDHLAWCYRRLMELHSHTSPLNVAWYSGALLLGMVAGSVGDRWSLAFLAETEQQVVSHLEHHLSHLPQHDVISRRLVTQMRAEEAEHRDMAYAAGAAHLPWYIKKIMACSARFMTRLAYYI